MSTTVTGKVERKELGMGAWALVADDGITYELMNAPAALVQSRSKVKVNGTIREDIMTIAMIGPVLDVVSFQVED